MQQTRKQNESCRAECELLQNEIYKAQDLRKRQQQNMYQLKNDLRYREKESDELRLKQQMLEKEHKQAQDRTKLMGEQVDQKAVQVDKVNQRLEATQREMANVSSSVNALDVQINDVDRSNARAIEVQKKLVRTQDQEIQRSLEQDTQVKVRDQKLRELEYSLEQNHKELEGVRYSNDALMDRNHDLQQELDSLNTHAELLGSQNKELQYELDSFIETDEVVKHNLDRKDKVHKIRSQVDEVIKKSMYELQSKSPARNARSPTQYEEKQAKKGNESQLQVSQVNTSQMRVSQHQQYLGESINYRGSPLRRGHLDQY